MRHFLVLGFSSNSNSEAGKQVHLGSDRGKAIEVVNSTGDGFARKQLYELAVPYMTRHFKQSTSTPEPTKSVAKKATAKA